MKPLGNLVSEIISGRRLISACFGNLGNMEDEERAKAFLLGYPITNGNLVNAHTVRFSTREETALSVKGLIEPLFVLSLLANLSSKGSSSFSPKEYMTALRDEDLCERLKTENADLMSLEHHLALIVSEYEKNPFIAEGGVFKYRTSLEPIGSDYSKKTSLDAPYIFDYHPIREASKSQNIVEKQQRIDMTHFILDCYALSRHIKDCYLELVFSGESEEQMIEYLTITHNETDEIDVSVIKDGEPYYDVYAQDSMSKKQDMNFPRKRSDVSLAWNRYIEIMNDPDAEQVFSIVRRLSELKQKLSKAGGR